MPTEVQWRRITGVCIQRACTERATHLVLAVDWEAQGLRPLLGCDEHATELEEHFRTQGAKAVAIA